MTRNCRSDLFRRSNSKRLALGAALAALLFGAGRSATAAPSDLVCQAELQKMDCSAVSGAWPASSPLIIKASCQECTGKGADLKCTPDEQLSAGTLSLETPTGTVLAGAFSEVGKCIGAPLWQFGGTLVSGELRLIATIGSHGRNLLLTFNVSGGSPPPPSEAGGPPSGDTSVNPGADGGGNPGSDGGSSSGDGGGPGGGADDGGCSCKSASGTSGRGLLLSAMLMLLLVLRTRRRRS